MEVGKIVLDIKAICPQCKGTGRVQYIGWTSGEQCNICKGVGSVEATRTQDSSGSTGFTGCEADVIGNARKRGAVDFVNGVVVGDNPYHDSDARHWAWMEGWAGAGLAAR